MKSGFFSNGGLPMLLGFIFMLAALKFGLSNQPENRWMVIFMVAGTTHFTGALSVQMRRIRCLENLLLGNTPEARKFRRRQQLLDKDVEKTPAA